MSSSPTQGVADNLDYTRRRAELPFGMENRDEATNYFAWQAELFKDHVKGTVIDHGAGTGGLTSAIHALGVPKLVALEPDPQLTAVLRTKFPPEGPTANVQVFEGTLDDYAAKAGAASVNLIVSSNVIEHIENDEACLRLMYETLKPGGALGLYIPARPELFGSLDEQVGHYRRYTKGEIVRKLEGAGFDVKVAAYRNLVGVLPWFVTGRVLKKKAIGRGSIRLFDRVVFPICRRLEEAIPPAYGLNLVAIGTKR